MYAYICTSDFVLWSVWTNTTVFAICIMTYLFLKLRYAEGWDHSRTFNISEQVRAIVLCCANETSIFIYLFFLLFFPLYIISLCLYRFHSFLRFVCGCPLHLACTVLLISLISINDDDMLNLFTLTLKYTPDSRKLDVAIWNLKINCVACYRHLILLTFKHPF